MKLLRVSHPARLLSAFAAALFLLLSLAATSALAQEQGQEQAWRAMLQKGFNDIEALGQQASRLHSWQPKVVLQTRQNVQDMQKKLAQLSLVSSLADANPYALRASLAAANKLAADAGTAFTATDTLSQNLHGLSDRLRAIERDFSKLALGSQDADLAPQLDYYQKYLNGLRPLVDRNVKLADAEQEPVTALREQLAQTMERMTAAIPKVWHDYYLTPKLSIVSPRVWRRASAQFQQRLGNLSTLQALAGNEERGQLRDSLIKSLLLAAVLSGIWLVARRRYPARFFPACPGRGRAVAVQAILGLALITGAQTAPSLIGDLLAVVAEILLARAIAELCWLDGARTDPGKRRNPLAPLTNLFALVLLIQVLDPPQPAGALLFAAACWLVVRGGKAETSSPTPFRQCALAARGVGVVLALAALSGWQNLATLAYTGFYLCCIGVCAGFSLTGRLRAAQSRLGVHENGAARLWLLRSLGYPAAYIGLFLAGMYWFCTGLGGQEVFLGLIFQQTEAGAVSFSLWRVFLLLTGFYLTRASVAATQTLVVQMAAPSENSDEIIPVDMIRAGSTYVLWGLYGLVVLKLLGVDMASLAVILGGLSVGVGFGLQNLVNNFVAGLILLFGRSIQSGDVIQVGETTGKVVKVNIRNTVVTTDNNATLFVPNSELIGKQLLNWTHKDPRLSKEIIVRTAYGADADHVRAILLQAAANAPHVLKDPPPKVSLQKFAETCLEFSLSVWINTMANANPTLAAIRDEIYRQGERQGIPWIPGAVAGKPSAPPVE